VRDAVEEERARSGHSVRVQAPDRDPLADVEAVPWQRLEHAYGPAIDVPAVLRAVRTDDERADGAIDQLLSTIWHQGTVYSATAEAVPFVAALALDEDLPVKRRALLGLLLFSIARGEGYYLVHGAEDAPRSEDVPARLEEETIVVAKCRRAVAQVVPAFIEGARAAALPRPLWYAAVGLALTTGVSTDIRKLREQPPAELPPFAQEGTAMLQALADGPVARDEAHRVAVLDEDLEDYFDSEMVDIDAVDGDHYFVDLLVERMIGAEIDRT
jgi:hypothetical protein